MLRSAVSLVITLVATTVLASGSVLADDLSLSFFEKHVRPVLVEHCYSCHSISSTKLSGGLLLDSRDGIRKGGESGKVIVPGSPADSLLIKALRYTDDSIMMPPKGKLPASVVADLELWVKIGAYDPREAPPRVKATVSWSETMQQRSNWWSLKPVQVTPPPHPIIGNASQEQVDRYIFARLEAAKLTPAEPADSGTLVRRLSLVLTGLPPTSEQVELFVREAGGPGERNPNYPQVVGRLVDSLLASPSFGERWARHWMDVVRFSETHGNEWNYEVHHAWRYRDYLIRAFNIDVPYDQFVREHIAGDLLSNPCPYPLLTSERPGSNGLFSVPVI